MKTSDKILWSVKPPQDKEEIWGCIQGDNITLKRFHNGLWRTIGGGNSGGSSSDNNVLVVRPTENYHEVDMGSEGVMEEAALVDTDFNTIAEAYKNGKIIIYSDTNLLDDDEPANYLLGYAETYEDKGGEIEIDWLYFYSVPFNSGGGSQVSSRRLCIQPYGDNTYANRQEDGWSVGQLV